MKKLLIIILLISCKCYGQKISEKDSAVWVNVIGVDTIIICCRESYTSGNSNIPIGVKHKKQKRDVDVTNLKTRYWHRVGIIDNYEPTVIKEEKQNLYNNHENVFKMWYLVGWVDRDIDYDNDFDYRSGSYQVFMSNLKERINESFKKILTK